MGNGTKMMTDSMGVLPQFTRSLMGASPYLLVLGIGLLMAVIRFRIHPAVSLLAGAGFLLHILVILGHGFAFAWLTFGMAYDEYADPEFQQWIFFGVGIVASIMRAIATGLIVMAIFGWRFPAEPARPGADQSS